MDWIFRRHVLRFTTGLMLYSFKTQEDGRRDHFDTLKDDTKRLQHDKNLLEVRVSQATISKR